jgi:mRNA interferase RelE/StbE
MKVNFTARFAKDLRNIQDEKLLCKIKEIIFDCKQANRLELLKHLKKLHGYDNLYRIRIHDYRIGLEIIDDEIKFSRCLQRKDIYRYFP